MEFRLTITCDNNDAFSEDMGAEIARILRETANKLERGQDSGTLHDYNGNKVGTFDTRGDNDNEE